MALEVDSAVWHSDSVSYRRDRERWNLLTRLGRVLVIATEFDLRERSAQVAADVLAALFPRRRWRVTGARRS